MIIHSEAEMLEFGRNFAKRLVLPAAIELVGDVGVGKTTFTRGLAAGLGIAEPVTSPSFTISKRYSFPLSNVDEPGTFGELVHYDFYRLDDPGIMREELDETLQSQNTVSVIEWGGSVSDILPAIKFRIAITLRPDGNREINLAQPENTND